METTKSRCGIRVKHTTLDRVKIKKQASFSQLNSKQLKKQHNTFPLDQFLVSSNFYGESTQNYRRITVPPILINTNSSRFLKNPNPQKSITVTDLRPETDTFSNAKLKSDSRASFRSKRINTHKLTKKGDKTLWVDTLKNDFLDTNFSKSNERCGQIRDKQANDDDQTSGSEKNFHKKSKEQKCLIAAKRKLPFSLQRITNQKKSLGKTSRIRSNEQLFDLDISIIMDQNQGPATPFVRKGSEIEGVIIA